MGIGFNDFVPPVVRRSLNYVRKHVIRDPSFRAHPFESVPFDVDPKWIMDVGANVGDITESALLTFPKAQVVCFEPVKSTFLTLQTRMSKFPGRTTLHNLALSDENRTGQINITSFHGANSIVPQSKMHRELHPHINEIKTEEIKLVRLDDFMSGAQPQNFDIMKIDVEGFELQVIKGGLNFIKNHVDIIMIEISLLRERSWESQDVFEIFNLLNNAGFRLINIYDPYHTNEKKPGSDIMLAQMDCVFRHRRNLRPI